jgi:cytochrome c
MRLVAPIFVLVALSAPIVGQAADLGAGKAIFAQTCEKCHSLQVGVNEVGPSLWHIVGRPTAAIPGYMYSDALKAMHTEWTEPELDAYLEKPRGDVHGAEMYFKGLPKQRDRANVIAYLRSQQ